MALATLTIDINAKLANIERDLGKVAHLADQNARKMEASFARAGAAFAAIGTALAGAGIVSGLKGVINAADDLGKLSQKIGISVEDLAGFKHAADLSGITLEQFAQGVKQTARYMGDYGDKLTAAGITATDAKGVMIQLADAFQSMPDGAQKTAIAMEIMGKSGAEMIPLLNGGGAALQAMMEEGQRFNPITTEMAKRAEVFNDNLTRMGAAASGVGIAIANDLLPPLVSFTGRLQQAFAPGLVDGFTSRWGAAFKGLAAGINETLAASEEFLAKITFGKVSENHLKQALQYRAAAKGIYADLSQMAEKAAPALAALPAGATNLKSLLGTQANASGKAAKEKSSPYAGLAGFGDNRSASEVMRELHAEDAAVERLVQKYVALADPLQKYRDELTEIQQLRTSGALTADQALEAEWAVNEAMDAQLERMNKLAEATDENKNFARDLGMTFTSAFEDAIVGGKKFSEVLKGLGDDIVRLLMRKNVTEPFANAIGDFDFSSLFSFNALGGVYSGAGISAYSGQVVSRPTVFPFASGIGLMGEAGPEAILPLTRGADGRLGVSGGGSNVQVNVINNAGGTRATARERNDGGTRIIDVMIEQVEAAIAGNVSSGRGALAGALSSSYGLNRAAGGF